MRILYTATSFLPAIGGAQNYLSKLNQQMIRRNYETKIVTFWDRNRYDWLLGTTLNSQHEQSYQRVQGTEVQILGIPIWEKLRIAPWVLNYYLMRQFSQQRIGMQLARIIERTNSHYQLVHNVRIGVSNLSYASLVLAKKARVPFVLTPLHHPKWSLPYYRPYVSIYKEADALIALTHAEKSMLIDLGVCAEKVHVIGMGPYLTSVQPTGSFREVYNIGKKMILFLGQKYRYKDFDALLGATKYVWEKHPDAYFVFVGPRTWYSRTRFQSIGDPRVREIGIVPEEVKADALSCASVVCLPSKQESFGAVFLEAWAFQKPVVGRAIPAVQEVIDHEHDGLLTNGDCRHLAEQIIRLLDEPTTARKMGINGRRKLDEKYNWKTIQEQTEAVYESLL